jgi:lipoprotein-anchoring transpeptidase ErfK/SrfK
LRTRTVIAVVAALLVLGGAAGGVYAYDRAHAGEIAKGVRVGGIDLSGLTRAQAHARLERLILEPLSRPIVVHHDRRSWRLGPREARISADLGAMVDEALARSRSGDVLGRTTRTLLGKSLDADLTPTVNYSDKAIVRMLDKIRKRIERPARNATATLNVSGVSMTEDRTGLQVRAATLHRRIREAIVSPTADRTFVARTRKLRPKVTTEELERRYSTAIVVNRSAFRLNLYKDLKLVKTYGIAVGQVGLETPAGEYDIQNKAVDPAWNVPNSDWAGELAGQIIPGGAPNNPLKARWMGIYDGAGIHGTDAVNSIGTAASHGCIRMRIPDVVELYDRVPVGAPVYIA